jgi:hypothetical protein
MRAIVLVLVAAVAVTVLAQSSSSYRITHTYALGGDGAWEIADRAGFAEHGARSGEPPDLPRLREVWPGTNIGSGQSTGAPRNVRPAGGRA